MRSFKAIVVSALVAAIAILFVTSGFYPTGSAIQSDDDKNDVENIGLSLNENTGTLKNPPKKPEESTSTSPAEREPDSANNTDPEGEPDNGRNIDPDKLMVALTFDDGPCDPCSNEIMDILAEYNSLATFFDVGSRAEVYPDIVAREVEMGFELGSHTYSHADLAKLSDEEAKAEMDKANDVFISITGKPASLLRPPYGSLGGKSPLSSIPVVTWSVDTLDWQSRDAEKIMQIIMDEGNLDGKVILMHSLYPSTVEALKTLVPYLIDNGYQLVTVSELAKYKYGDDLQPGTVYGYDYFR